MIIKRISCLILLTMAFCISAQARGKLQGYASRHGASFRSVEAVTLRGKTVDVCRDCTVSVYKGGTRALATIFDDEAETPKANPFKTDSNGFWSFYADNGQYDVEFSGAQIVTPFTERYFMTGVSLNAPPQCSVTQFGCGTNTVAATVIQVADSSNSSSLNSTTSATSFQTWRNVTNASPVIAYFFDLNRTGGQGDSYGVFSNLSYTANMSGFTDAVWQNALRAEIIMNPTNVGNGQAAGFAGWFRGLKYTGGNVRAVGAQIDSSNYSGADSDFDATTANSTIALAINTDSGSHNSVGIYMQAASNATAYSLGLRVTPNALYRYVLDLKDATFTLQGTVSVSNGSPTVTGSGTYFTKEIVPGDQLFIYGIPYTVASVSSDTSLTLAINHSGSLSGQTVFKSVVPLRVQNAGYLVARNNAGNADVKMMGIDVFDKLNIRNSSAIIFQNDPGTVEYGRFSSSGLQVSGTTFSNLGSPGNGTIIYCTDCQVQSTCAGSGSGAFAKRIAGQWVCN